MTNQLKFRDIRYCTDAEAPDLINEPQFRTLNPLDDDLYKVEMNRKKIKLNLPLHIGFFVYQYAKLRMLEFHFDFLDVFVDRSDYQICEMDTDSEYLALSTPTLEEAVKPEKKKEFYEVWPQWLPAEACDFHHGDFVATKCCGEVWTPTEPCCVDRKKFDKRTPGLFKVSIFHHKFHVISNKCPRLKYHIMYCLLQVEYEGDGMVGLCSKTYFCFGDTNKMSCKGISKRQNDLDRDTYLNVLKNKESGTGVNKGFRVKDNQMMTYTQTRAGLSYLYPKRKVAADGVSTTPLDL